MRSHWNRVSLTSNNQCPHKKGRGYTDIQRRCPVEHGGRIWRDVATSQGTPRIAKSLQKLGKARKDSTQSLQTQHVFADTLILDF